MKNTMHTMNKKWMAVTVAACMILGLTGCGNTQTPASSAASSAATAQSMAVTEESPETAQTPAVNLEPTVLLDQDGVRITALGYDPDAMLGAWVPLRIENTSDRNVEVQTQWGALNGWMMDALGYFTVEAGQTVEDHILFISTEVHRADAAAAAQITLQLGVTDSENYQEVANTGLVTLETSAAADYTPAALPEGTLVYEENGVRILASAADDEMLGSELRFWAENTSDRTVTIRYDDLQLSGLESQNTIAELLPGTREVDGLKLSGSAADCAGKTLKLKLNVMDSNTYETLADQQVDVTL